MKEEKYYIYLFRHGQTYYNKNKVFTGWKNSSLTPKGIKHAEKVARKLKRKKIGVAIQTRLSRSKDTLKIVIQYHPECKKIITNDKMIERSYGELEGTSHEKFIENVGKRLIDLKTEGDALENLSKRDRRKLGKFLGEQEYNIIHRGWDTPPPNGESFKMVEKRVKEFIKELKELIKKEKVNVAISAHGNSIRLFRKIWENATIDEATKWFIPYDKVFKYSVKVKN